MRILGIDYGDARTGLALSDISGLLASGAGVLHERDGGRLAALVASKAAECGAEQVVLGYPVNMNGTAGPRAEKTAEFAELLRSLGLTVTLWDERGTTADAGRRLFEAGRRGKKSKAVIDEAAATIILQSYLDGLRLRRGETGGST